MLDWRETGAQRVLFLFGVEELDEHARVVDRGQPVDPCLCFFVECLIGSDGIGKDGIAAE